jgi:hypothetical protein
MVVDQATGELHRVHTAKRCVAYVELHASGRWFATTIRTAYEQVRRGRQSDIWRQERDKLHAIQTPDELANHIAAIQRGLTRNAGKRREGQWRTRLAMAEEQWRHRGWDRAAIIDPPAPHGGGQRTTIGKRDCISTPNVPAAPIVHPSLPKCDQAKLDAVAYRACRPLNPPNVNAKLRRVTQEVGVIAALLELVPNDLAVLAATADEEFSP